MCNGLCMESLKLQEDLMRKSMELNKLEEELETLCSMSYIYDTDRVLQLDYEIIQKKMEISQVQSQISNCKCYQAKCKLQGITFKNVG